MIVYQYNYRGYLINSLLLNETDKSPSGAWNIPSHCTVVEPPQAEEGYRIKWNGIGWNYEKIPEVEEPQEPELSNEEQAKQDASMKKQDLREIAINTMMMTLAGNDISNMKNEYQVELLTISDDEATFIPEVFSQWSSNSVEYKLGDRVTYNGILYKVITAHTSQETWKPDVSPSLFVKVIASWDETIPEWEQPSADNAYMKGDKVMYKGKVYESLIDNNVWSPEGYPEGWREVEE